MTLLDRVPIGAIWQIRKNVICGSDAAVASIAAGTFICDSFWLVKSIRYFYRVLLFWRTRQIRISKRKCYRSRQRRNTKQQICMQSNTSNIFEYLLICEFSNTRLHLCWYPSVLLTFPLLHAQNNLPQNSQRALCFNSTKTSVPKLNSLPRRITL